MTRISESLRTLTGDRCTICGRWFYEGTGVPICPRCRADLQSYRGRRCEVCGHPVPPGIRLCSSCENRIAGDVGPPPEEFGPVIPLTLYGDRTALLLWEYKVTGRTSLARYFADEVYRVYQRTFPGYVVAPVPGGGKAVHKRGFDQMNLVSQHLVNRYGITVKRLLRRSRFTKSQKRLSREERKTNLQDKIKPRSHVPMPPAVVLLDDVTTTGATLLECAQTLLNAGVRHCGAITLAVEP